MGGKKNVYYIIIIILILNSCNNSILKLEKELSNSSKVIEQENRSHCDKNHDTFNFNELTLNRKPVARFEINEFLKTYPKFDSIYEGYYYYGKSYFLFDEELDEVITIGIFDNMLSLNDRYRINYNDLENKFPCSFTKSLDTEYNRKKCKVITLYDEKFNRIDIYYVHKEILGVVFTIDEV